MQRVCFVFALLVSLFVVKPAVVQAQCGAEPASITVLVALSASTPSFISLLGNVTRLARQEHAPGWGVMGVVSSLIGLAVHIPFTAINATANSSFCNDLIRPSLVLHSTFLLMNITTLVLSGANLSRLAYTRKRQRLDLRYRREYRRRKQRYKRYKRYDSSLGPKGQPGFMVVFQ